MRVDEAGNDHGIVVVRAFTEVLSRSDGRNTSVLDDDRAAFERRPCDRKDPVSGENAPHGSVTLAGWARAARLSMSTASQIDSS